MEEETKIEKTGEKTLDFLKKTQIWWIIGILIIAIILGVYIRTLPMADHGGHPGLWDITTNSWTLGPDLDPFLFLRYAKEIVQNGHLPALDSMRYSPIGSGYDRSGVTIAYLIILTNKIASLFGQMDISFAAAFAPVLEFVLIIIVYFFFVREIFARKNSSDHNLKANLISIIATFIMIVIPVFLPRTIAGIPEKEAIGFLFLFLSFYLFLKAWKSESLNRGLIMGGLAGIATAGMAVTWGGVIYIYVTIASAVFVAFLLNKVHKKELLIYLLWLIVSFIFPIFFYGGFANLDVKIFLTSLDTGFASLVLFIILIHFAIWNTKIFKSLEKIKLPKNITSIIVSGIILFLLILIVLGPGFIFEKINAINTLFFNPNTGRLSVTIAENAQPYFTQWSSELGPIIQGFPILFWLFFMGSIVLVKKSLDKINKKDAWILTGIYTLFLFGLIFSRYSSDSLFNGENLISKASYYLSALLLIGSLIYYYISYSKKAENPFEKIEFNNIFLLALLFLCLFTARGAIRLVMVLGTIAPILSSYLTVETSSVFTKTKDEVMKIILGVLAVLFIGLTIFMFWQFYNQVTTEAYNYVPNYYTQQWQKGMQWVRNETPPNAVFAHWWDYGYWLQSIGNRATMVDGGNSYPYWNYLVGRYALTGDNQKDALDLMYTHNVSYFLIDSTDIGKYGAFSSIGSNLTYDRYSWIGTFAISDKDTQETKNQTILFYTGGIALDEDMIINQGGKEILLPAQKTAVGAIVVTLEKNGNETKFDQPYAVIGNQAASYRVNLRYLDYNGNFIDFKNGTEGCAFIFPSIVTSGQGVSQNPMGATMFLSPRLMRGFLVQKYILNDPFNKFPNFKIAHIEPNPIVDSLNSQGMNLPDLVYYQGIQGPIKIWKVEYTGNEKVRQEFLDTNLLKYLNWSV